MAEIRKHRPTASSPISQALEKALGAAVRPVTPGSPPLPNQADGQRRTTPPRIAGIPGAGTAAGNSAWVSINPVGATRASTDDGLDGDQDLVD